MRGSRWIRTAEDIATPTPDNRIVSEPYTKRMTAFLGSDQGAALVVCSLAEAQRAGAADRAVFIWSGSEAVDIRSPSARPDLGRSPAIAAAGRALFRAANGGSRWEPIHRNRRHRGSRHSTPAFPQPSNWRRRLWIFDPFDSRGLSVTGGLPIRRTGKQLHDPRHRHADRNVARHRTTSLGSGRPSIRPRRSWVWPPDSDGSSPNSSRPRREPSPRPWIPARRHLTGPNSDRQRRPRCRSRGRRRHPATVVAATVIRDPDRTPVGAPWLHRPPPRRSAHGR